MNGVRLYYEEHGSGAPILCIHGTSSSSLAWSSAVEKLAELSRVIAYDRRGCGRSERPDPYERTSPGEQTDDARALLEALGATPAVVIGRSYGGDIALDLALRYPESVRALVLLEAGPVGLFAEYDAWVDATIEKVERASSERGIDAVGETLIREVLGEWEELPGELRELISANGPAILAELRGGVLAVDRAQLEALRRPTLLVSATDSPEAFRQVMDELARGIPGARAVRVGGGHLVNPADPSVLEFVAEVLER